MILPEFSTPGLQVGIESAGEISLLANPLTPPAPATEVRAEIYRLKS